MNRLLFGRAVRRIDATAPLPPGHEPVIVLSMVQHRDVLPYLLALKSFARYVQPGRIVVVADPSLDEGDRQMMRNHVPSIEFRKAIEFRREGIPVGGCWERLVAISEYVAQGYVMQLDADTVALSALDEVVDAARQGKAFTLGTAGIGRTIMAATEIASWARTQASEANSHVQLVAESKLDQIARGAELKYVRGCAGFAGYPHESFDGDALRTFSMQMARAMPERWSEWGTEQFTSNVMVANMPGARVLPHPKYCGSAGAVSESAFLHFIGSVRFASRLYEQVAVRVARELQSAA